MRNDMNTVAARKKLEQAREALTAKALTVHQLAAAIHVSKVHAHRYMTYLRGIPPRACRVFIEDWPYVGTGQNPRRAATYRWMITGDEPDAKKPRAMTAKQRAKRKAARLRSDDALKDRLNTTRRIRYQTRNGVLPHALPLTFFAPSSQ